MFANDISNFSNHCVSEGQSVRLGGSGRLRQFMQVLAEHRLPILSEKRMEGAMEYPRNGSLSDPVANLRIFSNVTLPLTLLPAETEHCIHLNNSPSSPH